jgi:aminoglycoside phosphotransferase family enzyme
MITEDQTAVVELLASPDAHGGEPVEKVETHASIVFLAGRRAWKLKRAVRYDYLDFSTANRRRAMCEAELRLNQRTAPTSIDRVVAVTREAGGNLALGGTGTPIDWVLEMSRFDQDELFDRLAARERLGVELMRPLAVAIARLHAGATHRNDHGGRAGMTWVVDGNDADFARQPAGVFDADACRRLGADARAAIDARAVCSRCAARPDSSVNATAICTCATSSGSTACRRCSTASNSTTRSPASTSCTTWRSC